MHGRAVGAAVILSLLAWPVQAQRVDRSRVALSQAAPSASPSTLHQDHVPQNQWLKGAEIGAGVGAALGILFYGVTRNISDTEPTSGQFFEAVFGTAIIFGLIGGLIGSFSRK